MDESASKLNGLMKDDVNTEMTWLLQLHNHNSSGREENIFFMASPMNSTSGFYQSFPYCVLPNISVTNISESEKTYFPLFEFV
jgi:hypothetical protein